MLLNRQVAAKSTGKCTKLEMGFFQNWVFFTQSRQILNEMGRISRTVVTRATSTSASQMPNFQAFSTASKRV